MPIGAKGQSTPGQDESPQIFETTEEIQAFGAWNELRPRQTEFIAPKLGLKTIYLKGTSTNLKQGDALYDASQAGADIDLIVRGICCLRPGIEGVSDRIRVRSIVGRFLEHSRVFAFGNGEDESVEYFMGSADLMPRNLDRRVEVVTPVTDARSRDRLREILEANLADDVNAWQLDRDGTWTKIATHSGVSATEVLAARALLVGHRPLDTDEGSG